MKVNIQGYYGKKNTGDDALVASVVLGIESQIENAFYYISSGSELALPADRKRVSYLSAKQWFRGQRRLEKLYQEVVTDWTLYGGGSLINDSSGIGYLKGIFRTIKLKKFLGKKVGMLAVGIGPLGSSASRDLASKIISSLDFISVRDFESASFCREFVGIEPEITYDLAFLLPKLINGSLRSRVRRISSRKVLGVAICHYDQFVGGGACRDEERLAKITKALKLVGMECGCDFALFEFHGGDVYGDSSLVDHLRGELSPISEVYDLPYSKNPSQVLKDIGQCDVVLAMRLHSAIFSYLTERPMIMIDYHPKCKGFSAQIDMKSEDVLSYNSFSVEILTNRLKAILEQGKVNYKTENLRDIIKKDNYFRFLKNK